MADNEWIKAITLDALPEHKPVAVDVDEEKVLLVRKGSQVFACGGKCTHQNAPLEQGVLEDHTIVCSWHDARFDITSGEMVSPPAFRNLDKYSVRIENGEVFVRSSERRPFPQPEEDDPRTFIVVGGGAAGHAAVETLRREAFGGRIVLISAEEALPYDRPSLSKSYLAGKTGKDLLPLRTKEFYAKHRIEMRTGTRVTGLDPEARRLRLEDGTTQAFDACLLATGGVPRNLDIPGVGLKNYFLLRSLADAEEIVAAADNADSAVVLGAGFIGLEVASALRQRDIEVHVVAPEVLPMKEHLGERVGTFLRRLHEERGVVFHLGTTAKEITGNGQLEAVVLADGTRLAADLVVAGVGIRPAVDYLEGTGLVVDGAVPVDVHLETKVKGIYAAGDIAVVADAHTGEGRRVEHWVVAQRQGQHAARAMLGSQTAYDEPPFFWTRQYGTSIKYVGHAHDADHVAYRGDFENGGFAAGYYQSGVLKAVAALNQGALPTHAATLLKAGKSVPPEVLENPDQDLSACAGKEHCDDSFR